MIETGIALVEALILIAFGLFCSITGFMAIFNGLR